jgi:hypothetical protein
MTIRPPTSKLPPIKLKEPTMTNTNTVAPTGGDGSDHLPDQPLDLPTTLLALIGACDAIAEILAVFLLAAVSDDATPTIPEVGEVRHGYKFTGGDPSDPKSWIR